MRPEYFTNQYGLIVDFLAEWVREMRKRNFGDAISKFFKLGRDLNQRDTIDLIRNIHGVGPVAELDGDEVGYLVAKVAEIKRRR